MKICSPAVALILSLGSSWATAECLERSESAPGATVFIIAPVDGAVVSSPVTIKFGASGMGVVAAGTVKANTGHHHLLVDGKRLPVMDKPMGLEVQHFGGGQTETTIELGAGTHSLQLIFGDLFHIPHLPPLVSEKISIVVN